MVAIVGLWIATFPFPWIREFGTLEPAKMDLTQSMCFLLLNKDGNVQAAVSGSVGCVYLGIVLVRGARAYEAYSKRKREHGGARMLVIWRFIRFSVSMRLIYPVCSAPTQSVSSDASQLLPYDLQPGRYNTASRALRV
jgi:hypothetical protein